MHYPTADLAKQDWDIWREVFGPEKDRVIRVAANQFGAPSRVDSLIRRLVETSAPDDPNRGFEILSAAPYFAPPTSSYTAATTADQIVADLLVAARGVGDQVGGLLAVRDSWEVRLGRKIPSIMYEGGQHLVASPSVPWYSAYLATQSHPGMYEATTAYLEELADRKVDCLMYYKYVGTPGQHGLWGAKASLFEPAD